MYKKILYIIIITFLFTIKNYAQFIPLGFLGNQSAIEEREHKVFYFSKDGDDNNTGISEAYPWKTINRLFYERILPGDTIRFKGGDTIYGRNVFNNIPFVSDTSDRIVINSYGTGKAFLRPDSSQVSVLEFNYKNKIKVEFSNLIFMGNYNPLTQLGGLTNYYGIVLTNTNSSDNSKISDSMVVDIDSCEFTKFVFVGAVFQHTIIWSSTTYLKRKGLFRLTNCSFYNLGDNGFIASGINGWNSYIYNNSITTIRGRSHNRYAFGLLLFNCSQVLFERNYVDSVGKYDSLGACGLYSGDCDSIIYRYNEVRNVYLNINSSPQEGTGLYFDGFCKYGIMEYNFIGNCYGTAIGMSMGENLIFRYNISIQDSCLSSSIGIGYGSTASKNIMIYNNLFYMKKRLNIGDAYWSNITVNIMRQQANLDSIYVYNNIIYLDSSRAWMIDSTKLNNKFFIYNNIYYDVRNDSSNLVGRTNLSAGAGKTFRMWKNLHNMSDSTGFEKTGGVYTYYNSTPYITYITKRHTKINPFNLDTLNSYKSTNYSSSLINHGVNYNNIVKRFADTSTVDFYGNAISYTAPDIGHYEFQGSSPSTVTLSSPANGTNFTIGSLFDFTWSSSTNATSYYIVIYNNLGDTVDSRSTVLITENFGIGYPETETYIWKVLARNQFGSSWSTTRTFTTSEF